MSTTQVVRPEGASHWYLTNNEGVKAFHSVPYAGKRGAAGETRSTTLRDARKVGALPSVTNVLGILHKEFLVAYKINQAILAALTLPRLDEEKEDAYARRVVDDAKEHAASAARLGSRLHEVGAEELVGTYVPEPGERVEGRVLADVATPLINLINRIRPTGMRTDKEFSEFYIANTEIGYAGQCDGFTWLNPKEQEVEVKLRDAGYGHLITKDMSPIIAMGDFKSRGADTKNAPIYETDLLQLAGYLHAIPTTPGLGFEVDPSNTPVANILINTHEKAGHPYFTPAGKESGHRWTAELIIHPKEELEKAWEAFKHAHALWCWVKNYQPGKEVAK
jgi:hypothetical protein